MSRKQYVLACLVAGKTNVFTPIQVQKLFFLAEKKVGADVGGPYFNFEPYLYGPFDKTLYSELEALIEDSLVTRVTGARWRSYALTPEGIHAGKQHLESLPTNVKSIIRQIADTAKPYLFVN